MAFSRSAKKFSIAELNMTCKSHADSVSNQTSLGPYLEVFTF